MKRAWDPGILDISMAMDISMDISMAMDISRIPGSQARFIRRYVETSERSRSSLKLFACARRSEFPEFPVF